MLQEVQDADGRRARRGLGRQHGRAAGGPRAGGRLPAGDGHRARPAASVRVGPQGGAPGPPRPRAATARRADPRRAVPGAARRAGRRQRPGRPEPWRVLAVVRGAPAVSRRRTQRPGLPAQPSISGRPGPQPGPRAWQRRDQGPVRGGGPGHHRRSRPGHRGPGATPRRHRRRSDPGCRPGGRRDRPCGCAVVRSGARSSSWSAPNLPVPPAWRCSPKRTTAGS